MHGYVLMFESKVEPFGQFVKLVDRIHHCSQLSATAMAEIDMDPSFLRLAETIHQKADQFEFELRTELARLAIEPPAPGDDPEIAFRSALILVLQSYQRALKSNIPAHARAMLTRQNEEMQKVYEEFLALSRAA
jgi:hypothetical protein